MTNQERLEIDKWKSHFEYLKFAGIEIDFNKSSIEDGIFVNLHIDFKVSDLDEAKKIYMAFAHKLHKRNSRLLGKKIRNELANTHS